MNHEYDQEIDRKPYLAEESRINMNRESKDQIDPNPHAWMIFSLQTDLKEAQVIQTIAMEETTGLKTELISWIEKWDVLRGKKFKYKELIKKILLKNQKLKKQNRINRTRAVRFKAKLDEARRSVPIRFSVESALKTWYFVFGDF